MQLGLSIHCVLETRLATVGGASASVFPKVEALLHDSEWHKALGRYLKEKNYTLDYRSIMDAFVVETFVDHRDHCEAFYEGHGPSLEDLISEKTRVSMESFLLRVLAYLLVNFKAKRKASWKTLLGEVNQIHTGE